MFNLDLFNIIFFIILFLIFGTIIFIVIRAFKEWNNNNKSPVLTVFAKVVAKRAHNSHHHHNSSMSMTDTVYYVTFEVESTDRIEFRVTGIEYGQLIEKDHGKLTFQGTRYKDFRRER